MTTNYFYKNSKAKFIEISGQDSVPFIQNLITNDINKCNLLKEDDNHTINSTTKNNRTNCMIKKFVYY